MKADRDKHAFQTEFAERINTIIFTKLRNEDSDKENKTKFNALDLTQITSKNNNMKKNTTNTILLKDLYKEKSEKTQLLSANVSANVTNFTVTGLHYFQDYEFHVRLIYVFCGTNKCIILGGTFSNNNIKQ